MPLVLWGFCLVAAGYTAHAVDLSNRKHPTGLAAGDNATWIASEVEPTQAVVTTGLSPGVMMRLSRARWIAEGSKTPKRVVYVFTDPECPYCNVLWKELRVIPAQDVQIRHLLVAVIKPSSAGKAAAILQSARPEDALAEHEKTYAQGGIAPAAVLTSESRETLAIHESLMDALKAYGTPALVYENERGSASLASGMPSHAQLLQILGGRTAAH